MSHWVCDGEAGWALADVQAIFYVFLKGFKFVDLLICLSTFPFLRDRSARWLDSRLRGPRFSLFVRRRGRLNPRNLSDFLLVDGGLLDFALVDFRVLPRPQCQLAGLASPRDLVLVYMSDGEAGVTLVVFLAYSFSESVDFYEFGVFRLFVRRRGSFNSRRFSADSSSEELAISGVYYLRDVVMEIAFFIF